MVDMLLNMNTNYNKEFDYLDKLTDENKVFSIYLSHPTSVEHFEKDLDKLKELYLDGYNQMEKNIENLLKYLM